MTEPLSHEQLREIQDQIRAGRKIEAIKLFRDATGVGLKEAKDAVEQMEAEGSTTQAAGGGAAPGHDPLPNADRQRVVAALRAGQKIEAIRIYREATGVGLKEAKDAAGMEAERRGYSHAMISARHSEGLAEDVVTMTSGGLADDLGRKIVMGQ